MKIFLHGAGRNSYPLLSGSSDYKDYPDLLEVKKEKKFKVIWAA